MIPRKLIFSLATLAVVLALAACDTVTPNTPAPNNPPALSTPSPAPTLNPKVDTTIIIDTSGGLAGIHKSLVVSPSGQATYTTGNTTKTQNLSQAQYATLLQQAAVTDVFNLKDSYDNGNVADDTYYKITVTQGNQTKSVRVAQVGGKDLTPKRLQDLIDQLNAIQTTLDK